MAQDQGLGAASEATEAQADFHMEGRVAQETVADSEGQADTGAQAEELQEVTGAPADSEVASEEAPEETIPGVRARSAVEVRAVLAARVAQAARVDLEVLEALVAQTTLQGLEV